MLILSIDTSCATAGVSLTKDGVVISEISVNDKNTHSVKLMPAIELLFKNVGLSVSDIDAVAVVNGPGSYTGLRIGVSAAKAIAYSAEVPAIGVNTLDYLARSANACGADYVCSVIDARNTHVYYGVYKASVENGRQKLTRVAEYGAMPSEELCEMLRTICNGKVIFCGDGVMANRDIFKNTLGENYIEADMSSLLGRISFAGMIAGEKYSEADDKSGFTAEALDVYYLRTPRISTPKNKSDVNV